MKIICIGRNYVAHVKELENEMPTEPVIFMKPDTALLRNNEPFFIPEFSNEVHYEIELVVKINRIGKYIGEKYAYRYYDEVGLGIDFTARDLQNKLKEKGLPWEKSKAFDKSAVISPEFWLKTELNSLDSIRFRLDNNGKTVQEGDSGLMIFPINTIISQVSRYFTLKIGDLIYTGTPAGVGSVKTGDRLQGYIGDKKMIDFLIK